MNGIPSPKRLSPSRMSTVLFSWVIVGTMTTYFKRGTPLIMRLRHLFDDGLSFDGNKDIFFTKK